MSASSWFRRRLSASASPTTLPVWWRLLSVRRAVCCMARSLIWTPARRRRCDWLLTALLALAIDLPHVHALVEIAEQVFAEIVGAHPGDVVILRLVAVAQARQHHHVKTLVSLDQRIHKPQRVGGVHVVVDVASDEQQVP